MKLTTRQRREKRHQQKVRAKLKKIKHHITSTLHGCIDQHATVCDAKEAVALALGGELGELSKLVAFHGMKDVKFEMDGDQQMVKMSFRMRRVDCIMDSK